MQILFDGFKNGAIDLEEFLYGKGNYALDTKGVSTPERDNLNKFNVFYVVKPRNNPNVFKIGKSSGDNRLTSYIRTYGYVKDTDCSGVELFYLEGSKKLEDKSVPKKMRKGTKVAVRSNRNNNAEQREYQMLKDLKDISEVDRGKEYFRISKEKLYKAILESHKRGFKSKKEFDADKARDVDDDDKIVEIVRHEMFKDKNKSNLIKKVVLKWNNPYPGIEPPLYESKAEEVRKLGRFADLGIWDMLKKYAKKNKIKFEKP